MTALTPGTGPSTELITIEELHACMHACPTAGGFTPLMLMRVAPPFLASRERPLGSGTYRGPTMVPLVWSPPRGLPHVSHPCGAAGAPIHLMRGGCVVFFFVNSRFSPGGWVRNEGLLANGGRKSGSVHIGSNNEAEEAPKTSAQDHAGCLRYRKRIVCLFQDLPSHHSV